MYATPKVKLVFDRRKRASTESNGAIEIEVSFAGNRIRLSTGIGVKLGEWKDGKVIKRLDAQILNKELNDKFNNVYDCALEMIREGNFCLDNFKDKVLSPRKMVQKINALDWIEERIMMRPIRESTRRQHLVMLRSIRDSKLFCTFKDFNTINIKKWDDILHSRIKNQISVHSYHKRLKPYITEAIQFGLIDTYPYKDLPIPCGKSTSLKFISEAERNRIEALELCSAEAKARDMFIFACYTGLAYSDIIKISIDDIKNDGENYFIRDSRQKTGSEYNIILLPQALTILRRYKFKLHLMTNEKCNYYLKIIAAKAGLKIALTMHMGRHTFATWALSSGVNIEVVSKMLAHTDIKTTQIYAKVLQNDVNAGFMKLKQNCLE